MIRSAATPATRRSAPADAVKTYSDLAQKFADEGVVVEHAIALTELGGVLRRAGDLAKAEDAVQKALHVFEHARQLAGKAASWHNLGDFFSAAGAEGKAEVAFQASIRIKQELKDDFGEAITRSALVRLFVSGGNLHGAIAEARRAYEMVEPFGTDRQR